MRGPDGSVYAPPEIDGEFWERYLGAFGSLTVVARLRDVEAPPAQGRLVPAEGVRFLAFPYYVGPVQYARRILDVRRAARRAVRDSAGAAIFRLPGVVGSQLARAARTVGRPYAVEMLGDPWESLSVVPGGPILRLLLRGALAARTRRDCRRAAVVSYVTRAALQRRYPPGRTALAAVCSDVDLPQEAFAARPRSFTAPARRLVAVGSLEVAYKGVDVLLDALARFPPSDRPMLTIVGGGRLLDDYRRHARRLRLDGNVGFAGRVAAGQGVRSELDGADVFVMPSLTEGLPRAMLEAMARGLPCVGSDVGGIPELLRPDELVPAGDPRALQRALAVLVADPARLTRLSAQNLARARDFSAELLEPRRAEAFRAVLERTAWSAAS